MFGVEACLLLVPAQDGGKVDEKMSFAIAKFQAIGSSLDKFDVSNMFILSLLV